MKKIALFVGYYLPHSGGVERYNYNLAKQLKKLGYEVVIVTTKYDEKLEYIEKDEIATIYRLPIYKTFSSRYPIVKKNKKYRELLKKLQKENIDSIILNTRFHLTSYVGAKFAKKQDIPVCLIEHGSTHFTVYNKILDFLGHIYEHLLTNKIKKLVKDYYGVSLKCNEWLKHFKINAKGEFYNCIDSEEYKLYCSNHKDEDKIIISYVGRMIREKGIFKIIEAYKLLKKQYSNIELILAGDGPILEEVKQNNNDITITGKINHEEVMKILDKTHIFIHPSEFAEGMPTSILEAGLMKCAIVATPAGGTKEVICDEKYGRICKAEVNDIKEKIEKIIKDNNIEKIGENINKRVIEEFSWQNSVEKISNQIKYKKR